MRELRSGEPGAIGPYRLVGVIGAGGMGQVFLGIAPDGRLAAVKQVLSSLAVDPSFRTRFGREVDASRRVSGAYTAAVMDADPHAQSPWLASVFVPGPSLQDAVAAHGPLPELALRRLTAGLAIALTEIHRAGLIHRDFKPGNVLLTDDGPRVIDFGIAQALHDAAPLTQTGAVIGSLGYMSPEQFEDRPLTPASDVFALGAVLAFAAGGVAPFGASSPQAMLYRVTMGEPDLSRVPPGVRPLIAGCLAKRPEHRPTTEQVLGAVGRLDPTRTWLPPAVHSMVLQQGQTAARLAGTAPGLSGRQPLVVGHHPAPPTDDPYRTATGYGPVSAPRPHLAVPPTGLQHPHSQPQPGRAPRRLPLVLGVVAAVVAIALATTFVVLQPFGSGDLAATEAAELVTAVSDVHSPSPAGFRVNDDPATPEVDGEAGDPLAIDRSRTNYACEVQADPPTPAEAGIVALSRTNYIEDIPIEAALARNALREQRFTSVAYVGAADRGQIIAEIRGRIGDCRSDVPAAFTAWRFSDSSVPDVEEAVGYAANLVPDGNYAPVVAACDFVRVEALVVRSCSLMSNTPPTVLTPDTTLNRDGDLQAANRQILAPMVAKARELQGL